MAQDRWRIRAEDGVKQVQVAGLLSPNGGEITRAWALSGLGVVLNPLWDAGEDLRSGALVEVSPDLVDEPCDIYACDPTRGLPTERVRPLIDSLAARLRPSPAG